MNRKVLITILTILGLTIAVGGFWYYLQLRNNTDLTRNDGEEKQERNQQMNNNKENENQNQEEQKNENENGEELDFEKIDTSNWKEYCNKEYGFCVKYPEGWKTREGNSNSDSVIISLNSLKNENLLNKIKEGNIYGEGYMDDIIVSFWQNVLEEDENIYNDLQITTLEEYINKSNMIKKISKINIDNAEAYAVIRYGFGAYYTIMMEHNNHLYQIMFGNIDSEKKLTNIDKAIINSFKFTK